MPAQLVDRGARQRQWFGADGSWCPSRRRSSPRRSRGRCAPCLRRGRPDSTAGHTARLGAFRCPRRARCMWRARDTSFGASSSSAPIISTGTGLGSIFAMRGGRADRDRVVADPPPPHCRVEHAAQDHMRLLDRGVRVALLGQRPVEPIELFGGDLADAAFTERRQDVPGRAPAIATQRRRFETLGFGLLEPGPNQLRHRARATDDRLTRHLDGELGQP